MKKVLEQIKGTWCDYFQPIFNGLFIGIWCEAGRTIHAYIEYCPPDSEVDILLYKQKNSLPAVPGVRLCAEVQGGFR